MATIDVAERFAKPFNIALTVPAGLQGSSIQARSIGLITLWIALRFVRCVVHGGRCGQAEFGCMDGRDREERIIRRSRAAIQFLQVFRLECFGKERAAARHQHDEYKTAGCAVAHELSVHGNTLASERNAPANQTGRNNGNIDLLQTAGSGRAQAGSGQSEETLDVAIGEADSSDSLKKRQERFPGRRGPASQVRAQRASQSWSR
jgi:hypothetical protein